MGIVASITFVAGESGLANLSRGGLAVLGTNRPHRLAIFDPTA
jgi:hypothetical protein